MKKQSTPLGVRIDLDLKATLQQMAEEEERSLANFIAVHLKKLAADWKAQQKKR